MTTDFFVSVFLYMVAISEVCYCKSENKILNGSLVDNSSVFDDQSLPYLKDIVINSGYNASNKSKTRHDDVLKLTSFPKTLNATSLEDQRQQLPVRMIIAGPVATVAIILFLCVAFYFHNAQLNRKAKRLSMTLYVKSSLRLEDQANFADGVSSPNHIQTPDDIDEERLEPPNARRKSTVSLSSPMINNFKRISSVSVDQAILTLSAPRRHSTFIL